MRHPTVSPVDHELDLEIYPLHQHGTMGDRFGRLITSPEPPSYPTRMTRKTSVLPLTHSTNGVPPLGTKQWAFAPPLDHDRRFGCGMP